MKFALEFENHNNYGFPEGTNPIRKRNKNQPDISPLIEVQIHV